MRRGQSLLETTIAVGVLLVALGAVTAAFGFRAVDERPAALRLIAFSALSDAAVELVAATAYDPAALAKVEAANWTVMPPVPPSPAPTGAAGPIEVSTRVDLFGGSRVVQIHAAAGATAVDGTFSLRYAAPPPGAVVDASTPVPR